MSIALTLDGETIQAALVTHLKTQLGFDTEGKTFTFDFTVGRKTASNPNPETKVVVKIHEGEQKEAPQLEDFYEVPDVTEEVTEESVEEVVETVVEDEPQEVGTVDVNEEDEDILPKDEPVKEPDLSTSDDDLFDD